MRTDKRRATRLALAGVLVTGGLALVAPATASAASGTPPWQQPGATNSDPNDVGTLAFYDAAGTQIYGGSVNSQPFAAYAVGSTAPAGTGTSAALYAYLPDPSSNAGAWSGGQLSAASAYPNASAPGALASSAPLQTGASGDTSLAGFIGAYPNTSSATGYANVYELRVRTSAPGSVASSTYDSADVQVTGSSWQVVYPAVLVDTTTSLTVSPSTGLATGSSVTLSATVNAGGSTATTATGTIHFAEGNTSLGSATVSNGTATKSVTIPHAGSTSLSATYVPDAASTYATSSAGLAVTVARASTRTTATWPHGTRHYGAKFSVKAAVSATGTTPTGTVAVKLGSKTLASATLGAGTATITVAGSALKPGKHTLTVVYAGSADAAGSTSAAKALTVAKAQSRTTDSVSPKKIRKSKHATLSVTVSGSGVHPTGEVTVFDGTRKIATHALSHGKAAIRLPRLTLGTHHLHAVYAGTATVAKSSGRAVALKVIR